MASNKNVRNLEKAEVRKGIKTKKMLKQKSKNDFFSRIKFSKFKFFCLFIYFIYFFVKTSFA